VVLSTEEVLKNHLRAFATGDADEVIKDFTEDSVFVLPDATLRGLDSIRTAYKKFFESLFKPGTYTITLDRSEVVGDVAYIVWHSVNQGADVTLGTDTFVIRDGKIAVQTVALKIENK
jgi:uncharacterized protein (TIGR02246 family)